VPGGGLSQIKYLPVHGSRIMHVAKRAGQPRWRGATRAVRKVRTPQGGVTANGRAR